MDLIKNLNERIRELSTVREGDLIRVTELREEEKGLGHIKVGSICKVTLINNKAKRGCNCSKKSLEYCETVSKDRCVLICSLDNEERLWSCYFKGEKVLKDELERTL